MLGPIHFPDAICHWELVSLTTFLACDLSSRRWGIKRPSIWSNLIVDIILRIKREDYLAQLVQTLVINHPLRTQDVLQPRL
jgi:hypothetical protein